MTEVKIVVRKYIENAFSSIDPKRFAQEPAYVAALMAKLDGLVWSDEEEGAFVIFRTTIVNDRGPKSAESRFGADFAITLDLQNDEDHITKATIGQAKLGSKDKLTTSELKNLKKQCQKMSIRTPDFLVLETPNKLGVCPMVRLSSNNNGLSLSEDLIRLDDYLIDYLIACLHGDTRSEFVSAVQESSLPGLEVIISGLDNKLNPEHTPKSPRTRP